MQWSEVCIATLDGGLKREKQIQLFCLNKQFLNSYSVPATLLGCRDMGSIRQVSALRKLIQASGHRCSERGSASVRGEPRLVGIEAEAWGGSEKNE